MTNYEIFTKVKEHLLTQQVRSVVTDEIIKLKSHLDKNSCAYRGKDELKCAVGCLIPDELYKPEMEGLSVQALMEMNMLPFINSENIMLLARLQNIHDYSEPENWEYELDCLAKDGKYVPV